MKDVSREQIETALRGLKEPYLGMDLVSANAVRDIRVQDGRVAVDVELGFPSGDYPSQLAGTLRELVRKLPGVREAEVQVGTQILSHAVQRNLTPLKGVKNIIAVASGKGGVGKSTVAVNLALALASDGAHVGMLDADIYGPSQPRMLGLKGRPSSKDGKRIVPMRGHGIQCMSVGFLVDEETPMVWRGPMVTQALMQLIGDTDWKDLDYLIVDMPPGTGDIQLTLSQRVPVSGAVIVTTPQEIALLDARKGLKMFQKVEVGILGIVENMSVHICSNCGHTEHIFGAGGGARMAEQYGVKLLGELPLDIHIREEADGGRPTVVAAPDSPRARAYFQMARRTAGALAIRARDRSSVFPKIVIEES
ncbi:MAG: iron-sulfur cluster carrier protein ApbC [Chloroflexota bacterium]